MRGLHVQQEQITILTQKKACRPSDFSIRNPVATSVSAKSHGATLLTSATAVGMVVARLGLCEYTSWSIRLVQWYLWLKTGCVLEVRPDPEVFATGGEAVDRFCGFAAFAT